MTRIYLDTCSIQRPLDSKTQIRIALEGDRFLKRARFFSDLSVHGVGPVELIGMLESWSAKLSRWQNNQGSHRCSVPRDRDCEHFALR